MFARLHDKKCKFKDVEKKDKPESAQLSNADRAKRITQHAKSVGINQVKPSQGFNAEVEVDMETSQGNRIHTRMVKA